MKLKYPVTHPDILTELRQDIVEQCGSYMKMSGVNGYVIMSGYENNHPDDEGTK